MTRRRAFLLILLAAVVPSLACAWLLWPRTKITCENYAKIKDGMTRAEVEAILGGPGRFESSSDWVFVEQHGAMNGTPFTRRVVSRPKSPDPRDWVSDCLWVSDCAFIIVAFDDDGAVRWHHAWPSSPGETFAERASRRLGM